MSNDITPERGPERPRVEPEIIGPGETFQSQSRRDRDNVFMQFGDGAGIYRIFIARPGWPAIIAALLVIGLFTAIVFIVLAGLVVLWIPLVVLGIVAAIISGSARTYWSRIKGFLSGQR
jgi:hypothetical protein